MSAGQRQVRQTTVCEGQRRSKREKCGGVWSGGIARVSAVVVTLHGVKWRVSKQERMGKSKPDVDR